MKVRITNKQGNPFGESAVTMKLPAIDVLRGVAAIGVVWFYDHFIQRPSHEFDRGFAWALQPAS